MGWTGERYEAAARAWDEQGRPEPVADAWEAMLMGCWLTSPGAKHEGVSDTLRDYHAALRRTLDRRHGDWLDDLFDGREHCSYCGTSWRSENCSICTACSRTFPPCCPDQRAFAALPNGNRGCPSCGRGEIVG